MMWISCSWCGTRSHRDWWGRWWMKIHLRTARHRRNAAWRAYANARPRGQW